MIDSILVADGIVNRTVCFFFHGECCSFKISIQVRNCKSYVLYRLPSTSQLPLRGRYCTTQRGEILQIL